MTEEDSTILPTPRKEGQGMTEGPLAWKNSKKGWHRA